MQFCIQIRLPVGGMIMIDTLALRVSMALREAGIAFEYLGGSTYSPRPHSLHSVRDLKRGLDIIIWTLLARKISPDTTISIAPLKGHVERREETRTYRLGDLARGT